MTIERQQAATGPRASARKTLFSRRSATLRAPSQRAVSPRWRNCFPAATKSARDPGRSRSVGDDAPRGRAGTARRPRPRGRVALLRPTHARHGAVHAPSRRPSKRRVVAGHGPRGQGGRRGCGGGSGAAQGRMRGRGGRALRGREARREGQALRGRGGQALRGAGVAGKAGVARAGRGRSEGRGRRRRAALRQGRWGAASCRRPEVSARRSRGLAGPGSRRAALRQAPSAPGAVSFRIRPG
jgi:hypothetical protein